MIACMKILLSARVWVRYAVVYLRAEGHQSSQAGQCYKSVWWSAHQPRGAVGDRAAADGRTPGYPDRARVLRCTARATFTMCADEKN